MSRRIVSGLYRNPYQLWMGLVLLLVAGVSSLMSLPRLEDPRLLNRFPAIETRFPGATPEQVEILVTEPIEEAIREVPQVAIIESTSATGLSIVNVELDDSVTSDNQNEIIAQLREKLDSVVLPTQALAPDLSTDGGGAGAYTLVLGVQATQPYFDMIEMGRLSNQILDLVRQIPGTEYARLMGEPDERVWIEVNADRLPDLGLGMGALANQVRQADINGASGVLRQGERNLTLNLQGGFDTVQRIADLPILVANGQSVTLGQIAHIRKGWKSPVDTLAWVDDLPTIHIAARVNPRARVDLWTASAISQAQAMAELWDSNYQLITVFEQRKYTQSRLAELTSNLVAGAGIVFLVVLVFMGWRAALIVGSALPLTFAGVLFGLSLLGVQIHQMSVFGMIIALGLLIDNAIVMVDEVRARIHRGIRPAQAMTDSVVYLRGPLFASTLTTVLGFAPILLLSGAIGDFIRAIAISVTLALITSFVLSMTLIPALTGRYPGKSASSGWLAQGVSLPGLTRLFRSVLVVLTRFSPAGVLLGMIPGVAGFALVGTLGMQFFPAADRDHFEVKITFAPTQSLAETELAYRRVYSLIQATVSPAQQSWTIGESHPAVYYNQIPDVTRNDAYLHGVLTFDSAGQSRAAIDQVQSNLEQALPNARVVVLPFGQGPPVAYPLTFRVFGPDLAVLADIGVQVRQIVQAHPKVLTSVATINQDGMRLGFQPDEARLRELGLSLSDLSQELAALTEGVAAGTLSDGLEEMTVAMRYSNEQRDSLMDISSARIYGPAGQAIPLSAVGQWSLEPEPAAITRYNGQRLNKVGGWLVTGALAIEVTDDIVAQLQSIALPEGYRLEIGGESEEQANSVGALAAYLPILMVGILATLILSFRSIRIAGVILFVGILSIGSGLLALVFSGFPLGFNPILGTAGLMGVAINGSIVVLAAIQASPSARLGDPEALVDAVMSCSRHILSTSLTTVGGFLPLMLGGGLFWPPLAVVIAGGVGFSVLLALVLTPALYRMVMWFRPKRVVDPEMVL